MSDISASVGNGGSNRPADVLLVQKMLNVVPEIRGGPQVQLVEDSISGVKTVGAISRLQQWCFGWADGRIDAAGQTIGKLVEELKLVQRMTETLRPIVQAQLARLTLSGVTPDVLLRDLQYLSPFRLAVLAVALAEMVPAPNGAVNDVMPAPPEKIPKTELVLQNPRFGWRRLKDYVDKGFPSLRPGVTVSEKEFYRGLMVRDARIEMGGPNGASNKLHWCGVFCAWVYRQRERLLPFVPPGKSLRDVTWIPGRLNMTPSTLSTALENRAYQIKPGDICHQPKGMNTHHFIVLSSAVNGKFWTLNSNGYLCSNEVKKWDLSTVQAWYPADSFLS